MNPLRQRLTLAALACCDKSDVRASELLALATLLEAEMRIVRLETIEECAAVAESLMVGGRAWTDHQAIAASALGQAAVSIRSLVSKKGVPA